MNKHSRKQIKLANSPRNLSPNLQTTQQYQSHTIYAPHLTLPAWMRQTQRRGKLSVVVSEEAK